MQKIMLKALELAGYKNANVLSEILNYVPNPQAATEMLLGVHEPLIVDEKTRYRGYKYSSDTEIVEIKEYNELANLVIYVTHQQATKRVYYVNREDREKKLYVEERPKDYYTEGNIPIPGIKTSDLQQEDMTKFFERNTQIFSLEQVAEKYAEWTKEPETELV